MAYFDDPYSDEDPYLAWARAQQSFALPGELSKQDIQPLPPPPPPPPPIQTLAQPGAPVVDEVPQGVVAPEPPPMQVDAVSQAAPALQVADLTNVSVEQPHVAQQDPSQLPDPYTAQMQQQTADGYAPDLSYSGLPSKNEADTAKAVNAMSPEQFIQYNSDREGAAVAEQARLKHEAEVANMDRARQDLDIQRAAVAKADADTQSMLTDAHELSLRQVNPDRYKQQRGIGQTVLDVVGSLFSGLGGDAEGAARMMDAKINRDIDAQKADIENGWKGIDTQRGAIHDQYSRHGDLYRAGEAYRIAAYESAINETQTKLQLFDPAGSSAIRGRMAIEGFRAQQQQAIINYNEKQRKDAIEMAKAQAAVAKDYAETQKLYAETMKITGALGGKKAKVVKFEDTPMTLAQLRGLGVQIPPNVQEPPTGLSINQAKKLAETGKTAEDWNKATRENSPDDINRKLAVGEIYDDQGNPVKFRDETFAGALANTKADVATGVSLIDEMIRARNDAGGWTSDLLKSDKWRNLQQAGSAWLLKSKNADQLGVLSGSDLELEMQKLTGGASLTGVRDPIPQLIVARSHMLDDLHSKITSQAVLPKGRSIPRWEPPNMASLKQTEPLVQGKTAVEQADDARHPLAAVSFRSNDTRMSNAEESANVGPTGLDVDSDKKVLATIKDAQAGNADAVQRLADTAGSGREAVSNAVLGRVRAEAPEVYAQVLAKLKPEQRAAIEEQTKVTPLRLAPAFSFTSLSVDDLAAQAHDDPALQQLIFTKAKSGSKAEKKKAQDVFAKLTGGKP